MRMTGQMNDLDDIEKYVHISIEMAAFFGLFSIENAAISMEILDVHKQSSTTN